MQKKKYRRINFRINHCSSEDPQYPVSQLLLQSPNSKGWQSKRFCQYPQAIILQLVQPSILKQISVLSHQSKISTKIVIHSKLDERKEWERLGYISLQSNVTTNFQSRELKTVNIRDTHSLFLRFSIEANYVNNHNLFNQVGIISLCAFGERVGGQQEQKPKKLQVGDFDKNTLAKIKNLEIQKKIAADEEEYDRAETIKKEIERIKNMGNTLMLLEEKKKKAVENENFEDAKIINQKIKKLRDSQGGGPNFSTRPSGTPSDYYRQKKQPQYDQPQYQEQQEEVYSISPMTLNKKKPSPLIKKKSPPKARKQSFEEDRPIQVRNQNPYENFEEEDQYKQKNGDEPQPLSKQIYNECSQYFPIFDEDIFMHLFSLNHANREKGLNFVRQEIMRGQGNKKHTVQAFFYVIRKMIDDKNASVLLNVLDLFGIGMKKLKPEPSSGLASQVDFILQKMNDYLGHTNEKIKRLTEDIYVSLPTFKLIGKDTCYKNLTVPSKREKPPKTLTGRLKAITDIVKQFQLGRNYDDIVVFATKYVDDKNGDVRAAAVSLICAVSNQIGYSAIQPFLKNVRPKIIQTIQQRIQQKGGRDDRDYDERPIKTKPAQQRNKKIEYEEMQNQNEFIEIPNKKVQNPQYTCDFCDRFDKKFQNENYRDLHLYNACPMLLICDQCKQAIEVSQYTSHLASQCKNSKYYKKCPRCKEAVHQRNYKSHTQKKQCIPAQPLAAANRCPLCHLDIDPGKQGWLTHLEKEGCDNNPRK